MITAIIQARTGSTRLPNKIFSDIVGKPFIWHVVNRLKFSKKIQRIVVATTDNPNDLEIAKWCTNNKVDCFRGSENDVLDRFYQAATFYRSSIIVRITADDPFKDPVVIDSVVEFFEKNALDFAYNNNPPSFPEGLDTEIFSFSALQKAALESKDNFEREHVTQYFYRNPKVFKQANFAYFKDVSDLRLTVDTKEDLELTKEIYSALFSAERLFLLNDILELLAKRPELKEINKNCERSTMYKKN